MSTALVADRDRKVCLLFMYLASTFPVSVLHPNERIRVVDGIYLICKQVSSQNTQG